MPAQPVVAEGRHRTEDPGAGTDYQIHKTEWFWHARSQASQKAYGGKAGLAVKVANYGEEAMRQGRKLLARWNLIDAATKLNLGGGTEKKAGFINVDKLDTADVLFDFEMLAAGLSLPFPDDSIDEIYSAHCLEHVRAVRELLREVVRVAKVGAKVEIVVPHHFSQQAMCHDHKQTISDHQVRDWTEHELGIKYWFGPCSKRLKVVSSSKVPGDNYGRWKALFPLLSDQDLYDLCPGAAFESRWIFEVIGFKSEPEA